jgi:hypothetical protein
LLLLWCVCVCVLFFKAPPTLKCPNSWFQVPTLCCVLEIIQGLFLCHVSSSDLLERRWGREREGEGLHDWWFCTGVQFQTRMKRRGHTGLVFQSLIFLVNLLAWAWVLRPRKKLQKPWKPRVIHAYQIWISHKMARLRCPCAFRPRRLVQNVGTYHLFFGIIWLLSFVTCPYAFPLHRLAQTLRPDLGPQNFPRKFSHGMDLVTCPCTFRLVKVLYRSFLEDLVKIWLASSNRSLHDLEQVLRRRSCGDPGELW